MRKALRIQAPVVLFGVAVTALAAPLLAGGHPLAALLIRSFFSRLCHQDPSRSFWIEGSPVAVCVRCLGIYCGIAMGGWLRKGKAVGERWLAAALLLNLFDVGAEALHWHSNLPWARFSLGWLLGMGVGAVLLSAPILQSNQQKA